MKIHHWLKIGEIIFDLVYCMFSDQLVTERSDATGDPRDVEQTTKQEKKSRKEVITQLQETVKVKVAVGNIRTDILHRQEYLPEDRSLFYYLGGCVEIFGANETQAYLVSKLDLKLENSKEIYEISRWYQDFGIDHLESLLFYKFKNKVFLY